MNAIVQFPDRAGRDGPTHDRQPVTVGEALVSALRQLPEPAKSTLSPIADEVEARS